LSGDENLDLENISSPRVRVRRLRTGAEGTYRPLRSYVTLVYRLHSSNGPNHQPKPKHRNPVKPLRSPSRLGLRRRLQLRANHPRRRKCWWITTASGWSYGRRWQQRRARCRPWNENPAMLAKETVSEPYTKVRHVLVCDPPSFNHVHCSSNTCRNARIHTFGYQADGASRR